jgi:hypothetical protein
MSGKAFIAVVVGWGLIGLAAVFSQFGGLIVAVCAGAVAMATAPAWGLLSLVAPGPGGVNFPVVIGLTLGLAGVVLAFLLYRAVRGFVARDRRKGFGYAALSLTLVAPFVLASLSLFGPVLPG